MRGRLLAEVLMTRPAPLEGRTSKGEAHALQGMVWIEGGTFRMGSDRHYPEEAPAHGVRVAGFWIDRTPVTKSWDTSVPTLVTS